MHRYSVLLFFTALMVSCGSDKVPADVIQPGKMALLLADVHLADGRVYMVSAPDSINKYGLGFYKAVFRKHEVDSAEFRRSFRYYAEHPIEMDKVYERVVAMLQARQDSVTKSIRVRDSLATARAGDSIRRKLKADSVGNARRIDSAKKKKNVLPR